MSNLQELRSLTTLPQLARLLGIKGSALSFILYKIPPENKYKNFFIPKKGGGFRAIAAPKPRLKLVQSRLGHLLSAIEAEIELSRTKPNCVVSHGFKKNFSIITNANFHKNKRYVFNLDLKDFFPSLNFGRVLGFFMKSKDFHLHPSISTIIAQIACHNNELPQGSPCSPVISNLIAHVLDMHLSRLAALHRCSFTRYADDLTFSTNEQHFPEEIARLVVGSKDKWVAGDDLTRVIYRSGFKVNEWKTRMQYYSSRQDTTGLIVNRKLNVRNEYYHRVRAMCDHLFAHGYCFTKHQEKTIFVPDRTLDGMLNHIYQIRKLKAEDFKKNQKAFSDLYTKFLDYKSFHGIEQPRIICEGKTDNVYLRAAIKSLAAKFPRIVENSVGMSTLLVSFFNHNKTAETFQLGGGGDQLNALIGKYRKKISSFEQKALHPVIMVIDNDSGSTNIFKHLTKILGKSVGGTDSYYYVFENLYVVPIPGKPGHTAIEDLFDKSVLDAKIDGRSFDRTNKETDGKKWYGKFEFATKIIQPNQKSIDFSKFESLLLAFEEVIEDYSKRVAN